LTPVEELADSLLGKFRAILIADNDVDLRPGAGANRIFVLKITEGSLVSGGRGGGFGERRVIKVSFFGSGGGKWEKTFETEDPSKLEAFEVPYHVTRIPVVLQDGTESMGYGVIERPLVDEFAGKANSFAEPPNP